MPRANRSLVATAALALTFLTGSVLADTKLVLSVPSKAAGEANQSHFYRHGYEADLAKLACAVMQAKCQIRESSVYPTEDNFGIPNADVAVFGSHIATKPESPAADFLEAVQALAEDGQVWELKIKYLLKDKPWPTKLKVGAEPGESEQIARDLCAHIQAICEVTVEPDFDALADDFDDRKLHLVVHSQSRLFYDKTLEDRMAVAQEELDRGLGATK